MPGLGSIAEYMDAFADADPESRENILKEVRAILDVGEGLTKMQASRQAMQVVAGQEQRTQEKHPAAMRKETAGAGQAEYKLAQAQKVGPLEIEQMQSIIDGLAKDLKIKEYEVSDLQRKSEAVARYVEKTQEYPESIRLGAELEPKRVVTAGAKAELAEKLPALTAKVKKLTEETKRRTLDYIIDTELDTATALQEYNKRAGEIDLMAAQAMKARTKPGASPQERIDSVVGIVNDMTKIRLAISEIEPIGTLQEILEVVPQDIAIYIQAAPNRDAAIKRLESSMDVYNGILRAEYGLDYDTLRIIGKRDPDKIHSEEIVDIDLSKIPKEVLSKFLGLGSSAVGVRAELRRRGEEEAEVPAAPAEAVPGQTREFIGPPEPAPTTPTGSQTQWDAIPYDQDAIIQGMME